MYLYTCVVLSWPTLTTHKCLRCMNFIIQYSFMILINVKILAYFTGGYWWRHAHPILFVLWKIQPDSKVQLSISSPKTLVVVPTQGVIHKDFVPTITIIMSTDNICRLTSTDRPLVPVLRWMTSGETPDTARGPISASTATPELSNSSRRDLRTNYGEASHPKPIIS